MNRADSNPKRFKIKFSGFTLIELLAVIAIIGVLFSILVVVFSDVREKAYSAKCAGKLRGLGAAINLYVVDNNGVMPTSGASNDFPENGGVREVPRSSAARRWQRVVSPYVPGSDVPTVNTSGMFHCPTVEVVDARGIYGINRLVANRYLHSFSELTELPVLCCMGETGGQLMNPNGPSPKALEYGWSGTVVPSGPSPNHGSPGLCNWLFADGRVESRVITDPSAWPWNDPDAFNP